jgi:hypothetical protein
MKTNHTVNELETRAAEALRKLLEQVSTVKLRELRSVAPSSGRSPGLVARIEVLGHSHTLACKVAASPRLHSVDAALAELRGESAHLGAEVTPVLIAPYLSTQARALCQASQTGSLDLEGNARLVFGEVFIARRSLPRRNRPSSNTAGRTAGRGAVQAIPPARAEIRFSAGSTAA